MKFKNFILKIIEINDICHFRAELDAYPRFDERNFYLEVELLFADLTLQHSEPNIDNP